MRIISLFSILSFLLSISIYAQNSPKTVSMSSADNNATAFGTEGTLGTDGATFYTHWDATYIYFGWSGGNTDYSSDMYFVAIDLMDGNGSSGNISNAAFSSASSDFYVVYENNSGHYGSPASNGNAFFLFQDDGSNGWNEVNATPGDDGTSSQVVFSAATEEVRLRIAWSALGFTPGSGNPFALTFWTNNSNNNNVWGSFPSNNPTSDFDGQTTTLTHKLFFPDSGSGVNPSTASTVELLSAVLPVELTHFSATIKGRQTELRFSTASEINNDYFEVQHSVDGHSWKKIGSLDGAGTTHAQQQYHFVDRYPLTGINYYRLKQVDYDGQFEYSEVLSIQFEAIGENVDIYPNPAQDVVRLNLPLGTGSIKLLDATGRVVRQMTPGLEQTTVEIGIQDLASGAYYLMLYGTSADLINTAKVVKRY